MAASPRAGHGSLLLFLLWALPSSFFLFSYPLLSPYATAVIFFLPHFPHFLFIDLAWSLVVLKHTGRCICSMLSQQGPPQTPGPSMKICSWGPTVHSLRGPSWTPPAHISLQTSEKTKPACIQAGEAGPRCDLIMSL